jgi:hypothetical protein
MKLKNKINQENDKKKIAIKRIWTKYNRWKKLEDEIEKKL